MGEERFTALIYASHYGYTDIIRLLLASGADVNARSASGGTALHRAVREEKNLEAIKALASAGANVNARNTSNNETPLSVAASRGHHEIVEALSEAGANVNANNEAAQPPRTPLHFAAWNRYMDDDDYRRTIEVLLQHGARDDWLSDVPGFDPYRFSALVLTHDTNGTVSVGNMPFLLGSHYAARPWVKPKTSTIGNTGTNVFQWENEATRDPVTIVVIPDFRFDCGTCAHPISRHALMFAGSARGTPPEWVAPCG